MEEKQPETIQKFSVPIAIFAAIVRVVIDFIPKVANTGPVIYYSTFAISFVLEIILIYFTIKLFKRQNYFKLSLREALKIGVIIMLIIGLTYSISSVIYDNYIDPDFQTNTAIAWGEMFGQGDAVRDSIQQNTEKKPIGGVLMSLLWFSFLGLLISVIIGSFLKTKTES